MTSSALVFGGRTRVRESPSIVEKSKMPDVKQRSCFKANFNVVLMVTYIQVSVHAVN